MREREGEREGGREREREREREGERDGSDIDTTGTSFPQFDMTVKSQEYINMCLIMTHVSSS